MKFIALYTGVEELVYLPKLAQRCSEGPGGAQYLHQPEGLQDVRCASPWAVGEVMGVSPENEGSTEKWPWNTA